MNELLTDIFEKYTKVEVDRTIQCECCIGRKRASNASVKRDKPWFTEECKIQYYNYKRALSIFNDNHSDENRMKLNLEKQKYKRLENKLKRLYKNKQENMFNSMRTSNPKRFNGKFRKRKKNVKNKISMDQFVDHFKNLISNDNVDNRQDTTDTMECVFEELDKPFTETDIKGLNRNKSPGVDNILNEYILEGKTILIPILCKLFNVILCTGRFPELWVKSVIVPLFKKGPVDDPGNYRGISLVSHIGKLLTSTINTRLMKWSEDNSVLTDAQFGFRPGYGTHDAIFALHSIISKSLRQGKRLYCCFIDYVKAFDSVSHFKLWLKLAKCGVTGKLLNLIKSMYSKLKSSVKHDGNFSDFF